MLKSTIFQSCQDPTAEFGFTLQEVFLQVYGLMTLKLDL